MATIYVAKDGNDGNSGASYALAKLSIGGAVTAASTGDTIQIGPGVYNEAVTTGNKTLTFQGDGYVIVDGTGGLTTGFNCTGTSKTLLINDIVVQNFTNGISMSASASFGAMVATRCWIRACTNGFLKNAGSTDDYAFTNTKITGCTTGINYSVGGMQSCAISRCVFADNTTGFTKTASGGTTIRHSIFANNGKHINFTNTAGTIVINWNDIWFDGTANSTWGGTTTTSFATWKSTSSQDANSVSQDPVFADRLKGVYHLATNSPLLTLLDDSAGGTGYGAGLSQFPVICWSDNDFEGNWDDFHLTDLVVNGSGNLELASGATSGTCLTEVYDLGSVRGLKRINLVTNLDANSAPTDVPDWETGDTQPRRLTFRYRYDTASFLWDDDEVDGPTWIEVEPSALGYVVTTAARYVQVEVTLRSDGA